MYICNYLYVYKDLLFYMTHVTRNRVKLGAARLCGGSGMNIDMTRLRPVSVIEHDPKRYEASSHKALALFHMYKAL